MLVIFITAFNGLSIVNIFVTGLGKTQKEKLLKFSFTLTVAESPTYTLMHAVQPNESITHAV